ncbi:MAG: pyridoxine 5'-phosphate synthase [Acidobacteria bacterium]|nr:pyridoxine 5'-phosphate synthase [Acidobacteriota bacterium]
MNQRLNVNIDHVATVREARKTIEPSIIAAAVICEHAGAHGITVHLRQDRRHIQDKDISLLREVVTTYLNVEMAATTEMVKIALAIKPDSVTLVPENPNEVTTEGGLDVASNFEAVSLAIKDLRDAGIFTSVFIDPEEKQIEAAKRAGAQQIEICTAEYADLTIGAKSSHSAGLERATEEIRRVRNAAQIAKNSGLIVAAGHGLTYRNVAALAVISEITEFNIGHNIISHSIFVGLNQAVKEMINAISNK